MDTLYAFLTIMTLGVLILRFSWIRNFRRGRPLLGSFQLFITTSLLFLIIASGLLIFATLGYQHLTYEQPIAKINIQKLGEQTFSAKLDFEDGTHQSYEIKGDEIYIDARILKWKPWVNLMGIHSLYRLDRIGGRYLNYTHELHKQRSLFQFEKNTSEDLFDYRLDYKILGSMVDAVYGNAAFVPVKDHYQYILTLSTSGLILREVPVSHKSN